MPDRPDLPSPSRERESLDATTDTSLIIAADVAIAGLASVTALAVPEATPMIAMLAAIVQQATPILIRVANKRGDAFYATIAERATGAGVNAANVLGGESIDESAAEAFYSAYQNVLRAIDPRASVALGRLVAGVLFDGEERDAFFRDAGQMLTEADAREWDALCELIGFLGGPIDVGTWNERHAEFADRLGTIHAMPRDVVDSARTHLDITGRVEGSSLVSFGATVSVSPRRAMQLLIRHGLAEAPHAATWDDRAPFPGVVIERGVAVRLARLIASD